VGAQVSCPQRDSLEATAVLPPYGRKVSCKLVEPRSRGLPEGFLDQPFYGWVRDEGVTAQPASAGFGFSRSNAKAFLQKRAEARGWICIHAEPGAKKRRSSNPVGKPRERGCGNDAISWQVLSEET
jgi:hypothetical protein